METSVRDDAPDVAQTKPAPQITVRAARVEDVDAVKAFIVPFVEAKKLLPRTTRELKKLVQTGFIALDGDKIVGFSTLEIYSKKLAELRSLCVDPTYQGMGIGKRLTQAGLSLARERHIFEVMVVTSAEQFFLSCGFDFTLPGEKKALFMQMREEP
jgi:amino-acid N-acetyltransferase